MGWTVPLCRLLSPRNHMVEIDMAKFGTGQTLNRLEDTRFLTGQGRYVDDIAPDGALRAFVLRSNVAHGEITHFDIADASAAPGVHLVLTAAGLEAAGVQIGLKGNLVENRNGSRGAAPLRPILAKGRVRFVGECVALVVADTLEQAMDAAEKIVFNTDDLPVSLSLAPGGATIHPEAPGNLAFDFAMGDEGTTDAAIAAAAHVVRLPVLGNRVIANPLEPRGAFAEWVAGRLHLTVNGQGVWDLKKDMARAFGVDADRIRIQNPDVGGGFGMKGMHYPEQFAVAAAAKILDRPVRWMAERTESMLSDNAGRDLETEAILAFDENLRITAYRVNILSNLGAYNSQFGQPIQSELFAKVLTGAYDIKTAFLSCRGVYTNTTQVDAYRGAGRPEAITTLERAMDHAARVLRVDGWDLRRRNFIPVAAFPYRTVTGELYDVGDFNRVMDRVRVEADVSGFAARRATSVAAGKLRGLGLCYYIESILGNADEAAAVEFNDDGTVSLLVGTQSNGQGHETVYAAFLAERTGIPLAAVRVVMGDSDRIPTGGGTGGSRSVTTQSHATIATIKVMVEAFSPFVAAELGIDAMAFDDGVFGAPGSNRKLTLIEAAELARAKGRHDLLKHRAEYVLPGRSYPNGAHVAEVEIDPETGETTLQRYTVTDDFGVLIHPRLVEGQIHGGVAQGLGQAITERVVYDEYGQLLTASFMDYALPRASDLPMIRFTTEPVPSTANPLGMKGCGEAGTVGALAAISNAVQDALWDLGIRHVDMPFTPHRVWNWLQEKKDAAA